MVKEFDAVRVSSFWECRLVLTPAVSDTVDLRPGGIRRQTRSRIRAREDTIWIPLDPNQIVELAGPC